MQFLVATREFQGHEQKSSLATSQIWDNGLSQNPSSCVEVARVQSDWEILTTRRAGEEFEEIEPDLGLL